MFLDMTLRSLWRHKARSFLTTLGIILAIAAIVSLGSISEGINSMMQEQMKLVSEFIVVAEKGTTSGGGNPFAGISSKVDTDIIPEIEQIDGVESVNRRTVMMDPATNMFIAGIDLDVLEVFDLDSVGFVEGDWPEGGELEVVVGYQASENLGLAVSDEIVLNEEEYIVSGVLNEMKNFMDYVVIASYDTIAETYDMEGYTTTLIIEPTDVRGAERVAREIEELYDDVEALTSAEAIERAEQSVDQLRVITLAVGFIASIVASIGIINTMMMVVMERKKEFGIMKALGARRETMLFVVLQEGIILAVVGGIIGISLGFVGTEGLNQSMGMPLASVTPMLAALSFAYGIGITIIASLYPAYQAIRVDPVDAMRET